MSMTKEEMEYYHDIGLMPDWAYNQQRGLTLEEAYDEYQKKKSIENQRLLRERAEQKQLEELVLKEVDKKVEEEVGKALDDLFKDFGGSNGNITIKL